MTTYRDKPNPVYPGPSLIDMLKNLPTRVDNYLDGLISPYAVDQVFDNLSERITSTKEALELAGDLVHDVRDKAKELREKAKEIASDHLTLSPFYVAFPFGSAFLVKDILFEPGKDGKSYVQRKGGKMIHGLGNLVSTLLPDFTSTAPRDTFGEVINTKFGLLIDNGLELIDIPLDVLDAIMFNESSGKTGKDTVIDYIDALDKILNVPLQFTDATARKSLSALDTVTSKLDEASYLIMPVLFGSGMIAHGCAHSAVIKLDSLGAAGSKVLDGVVKKESARASAMINAVSLPLIYDHKSFGVIMSRLNQVMATTGLDYVTTEPSMLHTYSALAGGQLPKENEAKERTFQHVVSLLDLYTEIGMEQVTIKYVHNQKLLVDVLSVLENYHSSPFRNDATLKRLIKGFGTNLVSDTIISFPNVASRSAVVQEFSASLTIGVDPFTTMLSYIGNDVNQLTNDLDQYGPALFDFMETIGYVGRIEGPQGSAKVAKALNQDSVKYMVEAYHNDPLVEEMFEDMDHPATPYDVVSYVATITKDASLVSKAAEFYTALVECESLDSERLEYFGQSINLMLTEYSGNKEIMHHVLDTLNAVVEGIGLPQGKSICDITAAITKMDELSLSLQEEYLVNSPEFMKNAEEQFCDVSIRYCALD
jgi:hypothetical protein